jgi:sec-independent protein translocase protein TatC
MEMSQTNDGTMPFLSHLKELRDRLKYCVAAIIVGFIIGYIVYEPVTAFLLEPIIKHPDIKINFETLIGPFATKLRVSMYIGIFIAIPILFYHILGFVGPALMSKEKKVVRIALVSTTILAFLGFALCIIYVIPFMVNFMVDVQPTIVEVDDEKQIVMYIGFLDAITVIIKLLVAFMALFQLPIILEVLMAMNLVTRKFLLKNAKYIIVILFILSAFITPPDIVSQVLLSLPLILLFYLSILVAKICGFGNSVDEDDDDEEEEEAPA